MALEHLLNGLKIPLKEALDLAGQLGVGRLDEGCQRRWGTCVVELRFNWTFDSNGMCVTWRRRSRPTRGFHIHGRPRGDVIGGGALPEPVRPGFQRRLECDVVDCLGELRELIQRLIDHRQLRGVGTVSGLRQLRRRVGDNRPLQIVNVADQGLEEGLQIRRGWGGFRIEDVPWFHRCRLHRLDRIDPYRGDDGVRSRHIRGARRRPRGAVGAGGRIGGLPATGVVGHRVLLGRFDRRPGTRDGHLGGPLGGLPRLLLFCRGGP